MLGSITLKRKKCPNSDGFLIMKADGYRSHETDCKTLNTVFLRRAGTVPDTYIVDYQCAGPKVRLGKKDALCFLAASISE